MNYSQKISERLWNQPDKGELESRREETFIDDIIQKSHIEKELLSHLEGIQTVFDGGAGCGRVLIFLSKQGCKIKHFYIFQPMIYKAKELGQKKGGQGYKVRTFNKRHRGRSQSHLASVDKFHALGSMFGLVHLSQAQGRAEDVPGGSIGFHGSSSSEPLWEDSPNPVQAPIQLTGARRQI